ncbi:RuBisCO transcriptional regulator [Streptococcus pyogenes]|nr:transcriptional regulator [Streptococcus pyogenes]QNF79512.1 LysR family transcriptional regulator substrate-binding protein [Streptococcus pyogenes]QNF81364.1 LysR family transcriptional regulator substrate-binding protein [Streptococcus pyogenes]TYL35667.1 transcriptional regulator [Streptococcus pyogenes]SUO65263.1 RuBisCO transcriptional regulator [Streptococcus pyogenes]
MSRGKIDIGLLSFLSIRKDITIELLQTSTKDYKVSIVLLKQHPLAQHPQLKLKDLKGYKIASLNDHYMLGEMLPRKCRALGFESDIVFKHNDWEVLIHSLQDILPSNFESLNQVDNLVWIPLQDKNNFYPIGIAYRDDASFSPVIEEFLSLLKTN